MLQRFDASEELRLEDLSQPKVITSFRFVRVRSLHALFERFAEPLPVANVFELLQTFLQVHGFPRLSPNRKCQRRSARLPEPARLWGSLITNWVMMGLRP